MEISKPFSYPNPRWSPNEWHMFYSVLPPCAVCHNPSRTSANKEPTRVCGVFVTPPPLLFGLGGSSLFAVATWQLFVLVCVHTTRRNTLFGIAMAFDRMHVSVSELETFPLRNTWEHAALCHWNARQIVSSTLRYVSAPASRARSVCSLIPATWECYVRIQLQRDALVLICGLIPVSRHLHRTKTRLSSKT